MALIEALNPDKEDIAIEIGPGDGAVTSYLVNTIKKVFAVEIDSELVPNLRNIFGNINSIKIVNQNILELNVTRLLDIQTLNYYKVIGSLPYNISKKIIDKFVRIKNKPIVMSFVLQKEVARDYIAKAPKGTFLSNYISIFFKSNYIKTINKKFFYPEPKVDGAIVQFVLKQKPEIDPSQLNDFVKFLKNCFRSPRKKLIKGLKSIYSENSWDNVFHELNINPLARAAELDIHKFISLFKLLSK